jgi:hypothetical protein
MPMRLGRGAIQEREGRAARRRIGSVPLIELGVDDRTFPGTAGLVMFRPVPSSRSADADCK